MLLLLFVCFSQTRREWTASKLGCILTHGSYVPCLYSTPFDMNLELYYECRRSTNKNNANRAENRYGDNMGHPSPSCISPRNVENFQLLRPYFGQKTNKNKNKTKNKTNKPKTKTKQTNKNKRKQRRKRKQKQQTNKQTKTFLHTPFALE